MAEVLPKLYLDTAHVANIARLRTGGFVPEQFHQAYEFLDRCITDIRCGLIFNSGGMLEWLEGDGSIESARRLAAVFDSARLLYWLEMDSIVFLAELLREVARIRPDLVVPELPILQLHRVGRPLQSGIGIIAAAVPGYIDEDKLVPELRGCVPPTCVEAHSIRDAIQPVARFGGIVASRPKQTNQARA